MRVKMKLVVQMTILPLDSQKEFSSCSTQRQDLHAARKTLLTFEIQSGKEGA